MVALKDRVVEEVVGMEGDGEEKCTQRQAEEWVPSELGVIGKRWTETRVWTKAAKKMEEEDVE